jgi:type II secretory pathway predicted ATPase ExeA
LALPHLLKYIYTHGSEEVIRRGKKIQASGYVDLVEHDDLLGSVAFRVKDDNYSTFYKVHVQQYKDSKNVVVFLDEAQMLKPKMLELVRTMLNFETSKAKLIQIVLAGQLELKEKLLDPTQRALRSRIFVHSLLDPLALGETRAMISHRCELADIAMPFTDACVEQIYQYTGGVPREVLKHCAIAYELAQMNGLQSVPAELIDEAHKQVVLS